MNEVQIRRALFLAANMLTPDERQAASNKTLRRIERDDPMESAALDADMTDMQTRVKNDFGPVAALQLVARLGLWMVAHPESF